MEVIDYMVEQVETEVDFAMSQIGRPFVHT